MTPMDFWSDLLDNIESVVTDMKQQPNFEKTKLVFVVVSHHHRMRKLILPVKATGMGRKKTGFAHTSAVTLASVVTKEGKVVSQKASIEVTSDGDTKTPSKKYAYVSSKTKMWEVLKVGQPSWSNHVFERLFKMANNKPMMVDIILCRHGESLHNGEDRVKSKGRSPRDSSLTQKGKEQADELGAAIAATITSPTIVVPIASYLNRSQHTALRAVASIAAKCDYNYNVVSNPNQFTLLDRFNRESENRENRLKGREVTPAEMSWKN
jgi:hypothetical protein